MNESITFEHVTKAVVAFAFNSHNLVKHTAVLLPIDNYISFGTFSNVVLDNSVTTDKHLI